ncbi:DUF736 family protein [Roseobacter weihaiensis]
MATIGTFKKTGNEYVGEIVTLNVQAQNVRIVPEDSTSGENAPSHRVLDQAAPRSAPPGRSARTRAATISASSWTIRASPNRSTPTSSMTRSSKAARKPSASSGRGPAARTATEHRDISPARETGRGCIAGGGQRLIGTQSDRCCIVCEWQLHSIASARSASRKHTARLRQT